MLYFQNVSMTIWQLLEDAKKTISYGSDTLAVEVLLSLVLGKERSFLVAHPEMSLSVGQERRFFKLFSRLSQGEPVAYITQKKEFYGLDFFVNKNVLIPRPETELLVWKAIEYIEQKKYIDKHFKVLDVGTGSGCIAVSLAKTMPMIDVTGIDISGQALLVAQKNAKNHLVSERISFVKGNLLTGIESSFDLIVANLPYIGTERFSFVSREAREFEPNIALFGGKDGLQLYEKLFSQLAAAIWKPKALFGEFGFLQRQELELSLQKYFPDAKKITFFQDYADIDRVFMVEWLHHA